MALPTSAPNSQCGAWFKPNPSDPEPAPVWDLLFVFDAYKGEPTDEAGNLTQYYHALSFSNGIVVIDQTKLFQRWVRYLELDFLELKELQAVRMRESIPPEIPIIPT